jgi:heme exporter protein D
MTEFLAMGGYAFYVWGAYGVTALAIVLEIVALRARRRRAFQDAQASAETSDAAAPLTASSRPASALQR